MSVKEALEHQWILKYGIDSKSDGNELKFMVSVADD